MSILWITALACGAAAAGPVEEQMHQDVVLQALVDELQRGQDDLQLEGLARPYFIQYWLTDAHRARVVAQLGALVSSSEDRGRRLRLQLRVGDYVLDNSNFGGGGRFDRGGGEGEVPIPIEDDYTAIRQAIWWATDREYKSAVETFEQKRAFMEGKIIDDKPSDFSREQPAVHFDDHLQVELDVQRLHGVAKSLSSIFTEYPLVKRSELSVEASLGNNYLVNSEGARMRTASHSCFLTVSASVQADDGMEFTDRVTAFAETVDDLPPAQELQRQCREMVARLLEVRAAPALDTYTGPVLFEPEAAAAIFANQFSRQFAGGQRALGARAQADDFEKKIGKRILPKFMSVVDDPAAKTLAGTATSGNYRFDDEGVAGQRVQLVEDGRLKTLLMSRNPSKAIERSNGHGRGPGAPSAGPGCLIVSAGQGSAPQALRQELLEACEDEDLEYGIRISRLGSESEARFAFARGRGGATIPLVMHKIYPDGREEAVRGAEIARVDARAFKRMLAAGAEPYVLNTGGSTGRTVAVPALLFEELDLARIDRDFDQPPILASPLAR